MKKSIWLALLLSLVLVLSGCTHSTEEAEPTATPGERYDFSADFEPEITPIADLDDEASAIIAQAFEQPVMIDEPITDDEDDPEASASVSDPASTVSADSVPSPTRDNILSSFTFQRLADERFGFLFDYPTSWVNVPGKSTVCFHEKVSDDDIPARVAVTRKKLVHTPNSNTTLAQFQDFARYIYNQYDSSTFEFGALNSDAIFMGQRGYEITYMAYKGENEMMGYMACTSIGRYVYVFHFSATYKDYVVLQPVMTRMRDSLSAVEEDS